MQNQLQPQDQGTSVTATPTADYGRWTVTATSSSRIYSEGANATPHSARSATPAYEQPSNPQPPPSPKTPHPPLPPRPHPKETISKTTPSWPLLPQSIRSSPLKLLESTTNPTLFQKTNHLLQSLWIQPPQRVWDSHQEVWDQQKVKDHQKTQNPHQELQEAHQETLKKAHQVTLKQFQHGILKESHQGILKESHQRTPRRNRNFPTPSTPNWPPKKKRSTPCNQKQTSSTTSKSGTSLSLTSTGRGLTRSPTPISSTTGTGLTCENQILMWTGPLCSITTGGTDLITEDLPRPQVLKKLLRISLWIPKEVTHILIKNQCLLRKNHQNTGLRLVLWMLPRGCWFRGGLRRWNRIRPPYLPLNSSPALPVTIFSSFKSITNFTSWFRNELSILHKSTSTKEFQVTYTRILLHFLPRTDWFISNFR